MKVDELIKEIRQTQPSALGQIPDDRAAALIEQVFRHINQKLAETQEGTVACADLGQFKIRQIEKEKDGRKVMKKRIIFRAARAERRKPGAGKRSA